MGATGWKDGGSMKGEREAGEQGRERGRWSESVAGRARGRRKGVGKGKTRREVSGREGGE